jgi:hypothetical protein
MATGASDCRRWCEACFLVLVNRVQEGVCLVRTRNFRPIPVHPTTLCWNAVLLSEQSMTSRLHILYSCVNDFIS